ncbi:MAG: hypothetical protein RR543_02860 [Erysipelotrichales bacterium]
MNKNMKRISLAVLLSVAVVGCSDDKAGADVYGTMGKESASKGEIYNASRISSKAEGFFNLADAQLLEKDYGYKTNKKVKSEVDKQADELEKNNPEVIKEYNVKSALELLEKSGSVLGIQREQYAKDKFLKDEINDKKLKEMYDAKKGELTSYYAIKLSEDMFEGDTTKLDGKVKEIEAKLEGAKKDDVRKTFEKIEKEFEDQNDGTTGLQENVDREQINESLLKEIDKMKYMEFNKKAINIEDGKYFILKLDKGERISFDASKEKLKDLAFEDAKGANSYLVDYYALKNREANNVKMNSKIDQMVYDGASKAIIDNYNDAIKTAEEGVQ